MHWLHHSGFSHLHHFSIEFETRLHYNDSIPSFCFQNHEKGERYYEIHSLFFHMSS